MAASITQIAPSLGERGKRLLDPAELYAVLQGIIDGSIPIGGSGGGSSPFGAATGNVSGQPAPAGTVGETIVNNLGGSPMVNGEQFTLFGTVDLTAGVWSITGLFETYSGITPAQPTVSMPGYFSFMLASSDGTQLSVNTNPVMSDVSDLGIVTPVGPMMVNSASPISIQALVWPFLDPSVSFTGAASVSCKITAVRVG